MGWLVSNYLRNGELRVPKDLDYSERVPGLYEGRDYTIIESGIPQLRDPFVLVEDGVYYMYGTGWIMYKNTSGDLSGPWEGPYRVVETPSDFKADYWAPEVYKYNGKYWLFTSYIAVGNEFHGITVFSSDSPEGPFRLELRKLRFHRTELLEILRIGLPSGLQGTVFSVSNVCIQTAVNGFGSAVIAGSAVGLNFEYISYFGLNGFIQACLTFTGQNYGAGERERCRKVWRISMTAGILACLLLNLGFWFSRPVLLGIFTRDPAVYAVAEERMRSVLLFQSIAATYEISGAALRGMGRPMVPALLTVFGSCVFRILWIWTVFRAFPELRVLFSVYPASWILTGLLVTGAYLRESQHSR